MLFKNAFSTHDKIFGNKFLKLCLVTLQEQPTFTAEYNLLPRALFPGCGGGSSKAREKRLGDEIEQSTGNVSYLPCSLSGAASKVSPCNYYSFCLVLVLSTFNILKLKLIFWLQIERGRF